MPKFVKKRVAIRNPVTLREFHEKRNKVLVMRETGGLGDMLIHRMMFEDFKRIMPECETILGCLPCYFDALDDHPYIDTLVDCRKTDPLDYIVSYNTTSACARHEIRMATLSWKHRSDIWANHCGVNLTNHDMHLRLSEEHVREGRRIVDDAAKDHPGPRVIFCPSSAMVTKDLRKDQIEPVVNYLRNLGCFVYSTHVMPIKELNDLDVPVLLKLSIRQWMGVINAADYVVTVDTSHFHLAGQLKKPLVGIFTFADGKVYGKYYEFELVQKHRDDGNWSCGPCYNWANCTKNPTTVPKPCLTEITPEMIISGIDRMFGRWPMEQQNDTSTRKELIGTK